MTKTKGAPASDSHDVLDLDALLQQRSPHRAQVRFGGRDWSLRRDLTGEEVVRFWSLATTQQDGEALGILLSEGATAVDKVAGEELSKLLEVLPQQARVDVTRRLFVAAGLHTSLDAEGDSSAS
ncbi:hypothetical protein [Actinosynnema mirum]|uniref:Uncharacterized protein n=1 Tax=Actinosynnema mirum (strain ATCC 29888 / DSM 43827 / JCM 3225 / NBRC 14064 / NCIMB 13271 / NRRL B-12336 / IMRU 3971 / 101) TaxID=446462 RepID=C6WC61_ACTMD|nr:hypothetical protein [Actinosynnema mirum]ACU39449.1 hypothetical protein Amir_5633 [Actinosynnema mirum DSM 43827]